MLDQTASPSANRRMFRSKVDDLRPTYGFEDVSLAPGTDTIEPADVELGQVFCGIELAIPILASAMDAVVDPAFAGRLAGLGGLAILNLEGVQTRYDEPGEILAADRRRAGRRGPRRAGRGLRRPDPRGPDRAADRRDPRGRLEGRGGRDAGRRPAVRAVQRRARRRPVPRPEPGLERPPPRVRLRPALARRVHPVHADPRRGRQHDEQPRGVRADGAGRRGRVRRRRAGRGLHDPRGPRHRRAAGHRHQRRRGRPRRVPRRDRVATSRSSPTAGCAGAASSRRRSPPAPTS